MRTLTHGDVVAAACLIRGLAGEARRQALVLLLERTEAADRYRKQTGRPHPDWGDGSLASASWQAGARPGEPHLSDQGYLEALSAVFEALLDHRQARAAHAGTVPFPAARGVLS